MHKKKVYETKIFLLVMVITLLAAFGAILHSPPSIVDTVTGATPKAKKEARQSELLEGNYVFCMNTASAKLVSFP